MTMPGNREDILKYCYQIGNPPGLIIRNVCAETFCYAYGITVRNLNDAQMAVKQVIVFLSGVRRQINFYLENIPGHFNLRR
jgi:hypothetical protein